VPPSPHQDKFRDGKASGCGVNQSANIHELLHLFPELVVGWLISWM
jgi:hypothetical protein